MSLPRGKVTNDETGAVVVAQQDPTRKDAAALLFVVQPSQASEDALLDTIAGQVAKDLKVSKREAISSVTS